MPANTFTLVWPIAVTLIFMAGLVVCIAALATLVTAVARTRQITRGYRSQTYLGAEDEALPEHLHRTHAARTGYWSGLETGSIETNTRDGIHYSPVP
ncbi:MAG: hypothetical protein IBX69_16690 [Anaerolineales bacterium]|jgi:hypothetical protein|nr:hypothetical protein [Anaerolineales bacterium]